MNTSYGIILLDHSLNILSINRRFSLAFLHIFNLNIIDISLINHLVQFCTKQELNLLHNLLSNKSLQHWYYTLNLHNIKIHNLKHKYNLLSSLNINLLNLHSIHTTTEWNFPKGKPKQYESNLNTAIRELFEETNIDISNIHITNKILVEDYISTNGINYINKYWIAFIINPIKTIVKNNINTLPITTKSQLLEVNRLEFIPLHIWKILIRPYETYRLKLLLELEQWIAFNTHTIKLLI